MDKMNQQSSGNKPELGKLLLKSIVWIVVVFIVAIGLLFGSAGTFDWERGWIFTLLFFVCVCANLVVLLMVNPEVIEERSKFDRNAKKWDVTLMSAGSLFILGTLVIAGLDERYVRSEMMGEPSLYAGMVLFTVGDTIILWAMAVNRWFSKLVKIQSERGHRVVTSGPYQYVRHPGYVGWALMWISIPLILGSSWSFVPALISIIIIVIRTHLEDSTLKKELAGYDEYSMKVKYRLIPGIW